MADDSIRDDDATPADDGSWLLPHLADLAPASIPVDVAARITSALAAEQPSGAGGQPVTGPTHARDRARRRWWPAALGVAAAGVVGVVVVSSLQSPTESRFAGPLGEVVPIASGTEYTPEAMTELVGRNLRTAATLTPAAVSVRQANFAGSTAGIDSCLVGVGNPRQQLAMLDLARFRNAPAAVLVFLSDSKDSSADVVVVGPGCSQRQPEVRHRTVAYVQR